MKAEDLLEEERGILQVNLRSGGIITNFGIKSEKKYLFKKDYEYIIKILREWQEEALEDGAQQGE